MAGLTRTLKFGLRPIWRNTLGQYLQLRRPASAPVATPTPRVCPDPANQIFFLLALPKSAGQAMGAVLNRCRAAGPIRVHHPDSMSCPNGNHVEFPLVDRVLRDMPDGGWCHTHVPATLMTLDFLHRHRIRHIVQVRHPLDQLVAYHCHIVKHDRMGISPGAPWRPELARTNPLAPIPATAFDSATPTEDALELLIEHGYFEAVLTWIGQWLRFRSPELSRVVRYEELVEKPHGLVRDIIAFLSPMLEVPKGGIDGAVAEMSAYAESSRRKDVPLESTSYPRGYTGRIGTHRDYLSPRLVERARFLFDRFCSQSCYGESMRSVYPTL